VSETTADLETLAVKLNPLVKFYDPLNLAEAEFWGASNEATIGFLRHAEIKHGRVAMFAFVGYIVHANGFKFPWAMNMDGTKFSDNVNTNPPALWDDISESAKWQISLVIGFLEFWSELSTDNNKHYMAGGRPGDFPDFQVNTSYHYYNYKHTLIYNKHRMDRMASLTPFPSTSSIPSSSARTKRWRRKNLG